MTEVRPEDYGETPTIEVRVYRDDELITRELCESEEQAAQVVQDWETVDERLECEVDDLSFRHRPGDLLEPEPTQPSEPDEEYPQ